MNTKRCAAMAVAAMAGAIAAAVAFSCGGATAAKAGGDASIDGALDGLADASDAGEEGPSSPCPSGLAQGACIGGGQQCNYLGPSGCGSGCTCHDGQWFCVPARCLDPDCPDADPGIGAQCDSGAFCNYVPPGTDGSTGDDTCLCDVTWSCSNIGFVPDPPNLCPTLQPSAPNPTPACLASLQGSCTYQRADGGCAGATCNCSAAGEWQCTALDCSNPSTCPCTWGCEVCN